MNNYLGLLIKLLIFLISLVLVIIALVFSKIVDFDSFKNSESTQKAKNNSDELSDEKIRKINDSMDQREERIKALKEVGKKLGG